MDKLAVIKMALEAEARNPHGEIIEIALDGDEVCITYRAPDNGRLYMATYGPDLEDDIDAYILYAD